LTKLAKNKGINNSSEKLKFLGFLGLMFKSCIFLKILKVKGSTMDLKGSTMDLKGSTMDLKGSTMHLKGSTIDLKGSTMHLKGSTMD